MRFAMGRISDGEPEYAKKICTFAQDIYRQLTLLAPNMDGKSETKKKMEIILNNVTKIEKGRFFH